MSENTSRKAKTEEALAFIDGAQGAAGHRVDDEGDREILRRQAAGEITADEARELFCKRLGLA